MANPYDPNAPISFDRDYISSALVPRLNTVIFATECSSNPAYINQFSYAGSNSSYSFGIYQYDVDANPRARAFLSRIGFSRANCASSATWPTVC